MLELVAQRDTVIKRRPRQSVDLPSADKFGLGHGQRVVVNWVKPAADHWLVELATPVQGFFNWYAYAAHVQISGERWKTGFATNEAGIALIKEFEGLRLRAYLCPANVWTIGWGHTPALPGQVISEPEAEVLLRQDLKRFESVLVQWITYGELTSNQFAACVSLAFNVGLGAFRHSSVLRWLNAGQIERAANSFLLWDKAVVGGVLQSLPGLQRRRQAERALFLRD